MILEPVPALAVNDVWEASRHLIQRAIDVEGDHTLAEVRKSLLERDRQLWLGLEDGVRAILITQVQKPVCYVELCAGEGIKCLPFLGVVEAWAKELGCTRMEIMGRKGWERVLKDYTFKSITLKKELL